MLKVRKKLVKKSTMVQNKKPQQEKRNPSVYERKKALKILQKIKPGIAGKDLVESMQYFFISGKNIISYNDRISIMHPFKTDFSAFVKADSFFNVMSKSSMNEFTMEKKDESVFVKSRENKKVNVKLSTITDDEVIIRIKSVDESLQKVKWFKLPENFTECINLCAFAASTSELDSTMSSVRIDENMCVASDNSRIAKAILEKKMQSMFIKASEVKNLTSIDPSSYTLSKAWLHFKNKEGCIFSIRRIEGSYPDFFPHFDFEGDKVTLPQDITEGTDLATIFTDAVEQPFIEITVHKNKCKLSVQSEGGGLKFSTDIKYTGNKVEFKVNPSFLAEMMKHSTTIIFTEGKAKLETENFSLVTALFGRE